MLLGNYRLHYPDTPTDPPLVDSATPCNPLTFLATAVMLVVGVVGPVAALVGRALRLT